jgi:hypothetical protein
MAENSMVLNAQWASRPDDQRFLTMADLHARVSARRERSSEVGADLPNLRVIPVEGGDLILGDASGRRLGKMTNWGFGQLCQRAHAPAAFLRELPNVIAASALQWQIEHSIGADDRDAKMLMWQSPKGIPYVAAATSGSYGRIWDGGSDGVSGAIMRRVDLDVWKVPAASYQDSDPLRATTLYASDRDMFVFLCDQENAIEIPGEPAPKFRGFYVSNSEVGKGKCILATMLFDRVCDNRIIWGMDGFREFAIRHTAGGPMRFLAEMQPMLGKFLNAGTGGEVKAITAAQSKIVGKDRDEVIEWMRDRGFGLAVARDAYAAAEKEGIRNPRSLWGVVSGVTEVAHKITHTDVRVDLERKASGLLDLVAA